MAGARRSGARSSGSRSASDGRRRSRSCDGWRSCLDGATLVAVLALAVMLRRRRGATRAYRPSVIDPTAEFFDDSVVHELRLWINSRDWETLKTNFLSNAYYPADLQWKTTTVRNVGIRSRGNGSRSGFKPGLRVDIDRYSSAQKFLGAEVVRAAQQHAGPVADARVAQHAVLPAHGPARIARSLRASLRQRQVRRPLHHRRVGGQIVPDATVRRGRAATSSTTTTRRMRRRTTSRTAAATRRATCRCRSSPRRTRTTRAPRSSPIW